MVASAKVRTRVVTGIVFVALSRHGTVGSMALASLEQSYYCSLIVAVVLQPKNVPSRSADCLVQRRSTVIIIVGGWYICLRHIHCVTRLE